MDGIYILANDIVYDQLVALLNSIEVNVGADIPICILPYDDRLTQVKAEIATRSQVSLFDNQASIAYWDDYATQVWHAHESAQQAWKAKGWASVHALGMHRKFCSLDGDFERFVYFDADTLAIGSLDPIFEQLQHHDWVANDYQFLSDINYVLDTTSPKFAQLFELEAARAKIFCAGWFASRRRVIARSQLEQLRDRLIAGDVEVLPWRGPDQSLFNYLVQQSGISFYNVAHSNAATGSHWSSQFEEKDHLLYDQGNRLTYLHYMSVASTQFTQLCQGYDVAIPYRDLFLHYRYLKAPAQRPTRLVPLKSPHPIRQFVQRKMGNLKYRLRQFL
jgi:hypothetical protein